MNQDTLRLLEFEKILKAVSGYSHCDATGRAIMALRPLSDREVLQTRFGLIKEILRIDREGNPLKLSTFNDIKPLIEMLRPEDSILEGRELYAFIPVLMVISELSKQIRGNAESRFLNALAIGMSGFPGLFHSLSSSIDSDGYVLDTASPLLSQIRRDIRALERKIRKRLEDKMSEKYTAPFLQDTFVSQRAGRWVIPVRMDSKGRVQGVVHDVSRSGETAFMEPIEIIGLANELENLIADEKTEIIRILKSLSGKIRDVGEDLMRQFETLVHLDLLNSIVRFSESLKMEIPLIGDSLRIKLLKARHPLLELMRMSGIVKNIVPLDIELGGKNAVMVITGPNAGGKTISIKTVGLLLLMALSGIPIPAEPSSSIPFVEDILVDIGDEQSIEANLSTFSAHISRISDILRSGKLNTVVLLDELGTGTEPSQGSAIACSVLRELRRKGCLVIATTHLTEIVSFVFREEGMINASMEFDSEKLTPLYRLRIGEPGQSHAFEIAMRYGLPEDVINCAKEFLGRMNIEFFDLLSELRMKTKSYEEALAELKRKNKEHEENDKKIKERFEEIEIKRKEIEEDAYREAESIIRKTKQEMHILFEESRKKSRDSLKKAEKMHDEIVRKIRSFKSELPILIDEIKEGDIVFVISIGYDAKVTGIDRKHMRLKVSAREKDIEVPVSDTTNRKGVEPRDSIVYEEIAERPALFKLNLIGLRVDEALSRLEPFLNDAALAGLEEVVIVHGVGTGALMKAVRLHLKGHPLVSGFRSGELNEGGRGITIANLR